MILTAIIWFVVGVAVTLGVVRMIAEGDKQLDSLLEGDSGLHFDEETMLKAYRGVMGTGLSLAEATDVISAIRNEGIVFREPR